MTRILSMLVAVVVGAGYIGLELAEASYKGLVVWSNDEMFSAGADLQSMLPAFMMGGADAIGGAEEQMQQAMLKLRYSNVPVVSEQPAIADVLGVTYGEPIADINGWADVFHDSTLAPAAPHPDMFLGPLGKLTRTIAPHVPWDPVAFHVQALPGFRSWW